MNFLLFKLQFTTAVHFGLSDSALSLYSSGETFCADTLFSALCHTALSHYGPDGVVTLCNWVKDDMLRLSDAMPWQGDTLYLPKPLLQADHSRELPAVERKAMKKLQWIPAEAFRELICSLTGDPIFNPRCYVTHFGQMAEVTRARIFDSKNAIPYAIGTFVFNPDCGLYFLVQYKDEQQAEMLRRLLESLGYSGIGGKISSGYGRFFIEDEIYLNEPFDTQTDWFSHALQVDCGNYMLISTSLPRDAELNDTLAGASFALVRRAGFVQSNTYADSARKKRTQFFLASGSVLSCRFNGDLYDVGGNGRHPVYRYGRPIFLGVAL